MDDSRGFTLLELLIVIVILAVVLSMSIAGYRHARMRGGEAAAIAALEAINQGQFAFMQTCGRQRYATSLTSLGVAPAGGTPFLSPDLTAADQITKSGYGLQMAGTPADDPPPEPTCTGVPAADGYQATADPLSPGVSGLRYFGTNRDRVLYEDTTTFSGNMPEAGAPSHGRELSARGRR
ncbi:MAG TPA: prepilin-type N-terminal cleavage/methylation domain-containing protein [Vicinamibacterales bacterium]|nr:prepilin-type N-terminal cleavage/methylation domain-containing protein [Vicinamibacterales bacterium]